MLRGAAKGKISSVAVDTGANIGGSNMGGSGGGTSSSVQIWGGGDNN